jgi:hypothetical protein
MTEPPRSRSYRWLAHPRAPWFAVALGALLTLAGLRNGLVLDDLYHRQVSLHGTGWMGQPKAFWDLFNFFPNDPAIEQLGHETGFWPWWMSDISIAFFRPVSSLTHALDFALWPETPVLMHLQSTLWYVALLTVVVLAFRSLFGAGLVTGLGTLLMAVNANHGASVGWLATRNMLIASTFAIATLATHHAWRRHDWTPGRWLSPLLLLLALCSAEFGLGILGYLVAYAAFMERGSIARRIAPIAPHLVTIVGWQIGYKLMGYGTQGTGLYLHPLSAPLAFAEATLARWPVFVASELTIPLTEVWGFVPPSAELYFAAFCALAFAALGYLLFAPVLRADPRARMLAAGAVLAAVPCCATFPHSRMLLLMGFGASGLFALAAEHHVEHGLSRVRRAILGAFLFRHTVLAALMFVMTVSSVVRLGAIFERADASIPSDPALSQQTLVVVNAPHAFLAMFLELHREQNGGPSPARLRILGTVMAEVEVTRVAEDRLRVRTEGGYLEGRGHHLTWKPGQRRDTGFRIDLGDMVAEVVEATVDGRPMTVDFTFRGPLQGVRWVTWVGDRYQPFEVPAVGQSTTLAAPNLEQVLFGG